MKDALLIVAIVISAFAIIYVATMPNAVGIGHGRADAAEIRVVALSTEVADLRPTPKPCSFYLGYPYPAC